MAPTRAKDPSMPVTETGSADRLLAELRQWVEHETPTPDGAAVNGLMDKAEAELRAVGAAIERLPGSQGFGDTLIARTPGEGAPVVVAGHLDTVWDHGTLARSMPFRVEGERAVIARSPDLLALADSVSVPAAKRGTPWNDVLSQTRRARTAARR